MTTPYKPMTTSETTWLRIAKLAFFVIGVSGICTAAYLKHTGYWHLKRWRTSTAFAPTVRELLRSNEMYNYVISHAHQVSGPAEIHIEGTLESEGQLGQLKADIEALDSPVPIKYRVIVTDDLRKAKALYKQLENDGLAPNRWVFNSLLNGTFCLIYEDKKIESLEPLRNKPIYALMLKNSPVKDLTPLADVPIDSLRFDPLAVTKGMDVLRKIKTLEQINCMSSSEFWELHDAGEHDLTQTD